MIFYRRLRLVAAGLLPLPLLGRKDAFSNELGSMPDATGQVDGEYGDDRATDRGPADQNRPFPAEVTIPFMAARAVEPGAPASLVIDAYEA